MARCIKVQRRRKQIYVGQMNEQIKLQDRAITTPVDDGVDYGEEFTNDNVVWAWMQTVRGRTEFDSTNIERVVTHEVAIRFVEGITAETWYEFKGEMYDIINVENIDERDEFLMFDAMVRGNKEVQVNLS